MKAEEDGKDKIIIMMMVQQRLRDENTNSGRFVDRWLNISGSLGNYSLVFVQQDGQVFCKKMLNAFTERSKSINKYIFYSKLTLFF